MVYVPNVWVDETGSGNGTVVNALRMNHIEQGIADHNADIQAARDYADSKWPVAPPNDAGMSFDAASGLWKPSDYITEANAYYASRYPVYEYEIRHATGTGYVALTTSGQNIPNLVSIQIATGDAEVYWEVECMASILQKLDAAYHYAYLQVTMDKADLDGIQQGASIETQHSGVQQYTFRYAKQVFYLAAYDMYTVRATWGPQTSGGVQVGTWQINTLPTYLWISAKAYRIGG